MIKSPGGGQQAPGRAHVVPAFQHHQDKEEEKEEPWRERGIWRFGAGRMEAAVARSVEILPSRTVLLTIAHAQIRGPFPRLDKKIKPCFYRHSCPPPFSPSPTPNRHQAPTEKA